MACAPRLTLIPSPHQRCLPADQDNGGLAFLEPDFGVTSRAFETVTRGDPEAILTKRLILAAESVAAILPASLQLFSFLRFL
jgi:hypothetical protein